jgi:hypothetical protein
LAKSRSAVRPSPSASAPAASAVDSTVVRGGGYTTALALLAATLAASPGRGARVSSGFPCSSQAPIWTSSPSATMPTRATTRIHPEPPASTRPKRATAPPPSS